MPMILPNDDHQALMADLKSALAKHPELTSVEYLALAAQLVGNLLAFQDQTAGDNSFYIGIVQRNIQIGNDTAIQAFWSGPVANEKPV